MYPRTVSVRRPNNPNTGVGGLPYSGETKAQETTLLTGIPANIQQTRARGIPQAGVPGDAPDRIQWHIFIRRVPNGQIQVHDIVVDDLGLRYVVVSAYWNSLGYRLLAELLET